jgi:CheY-like chemotaxis protein
MRATLRVLVVDPCPDTVASTAWLLRWWGHEVRAAADAPAALETARTFRPEAVLSEIALPGMDGCALARRLRQPDGAPEALLVAVTGYATSRYCRRCGAAGFHYLFVKPGDPGVLEVLLTDLAHRRSAVGELARRRPVETAAAAPSGLPAPLPC